MFLIVHDVPVYFETLERRKTTSKRCAFKKILTGFHGDARSGDFFLDFLIYHSRIRPEMTNKFLIIKKKEKKITSREEKKWVCQRYFLKICINSFFHHKYVYVQICSYN